MPLELDFARFIKYASDVTDNYVSHNAFQWQQAQWQTVS